MHTPLTLINGSPMQHRILVVAIFLFSHTPSLFAGVGESAVITLVFPYGARASAMGEVGTALANDESALFFNPAGLGIRNDSWRKGAVSYSREELLPVFEIDDLWHSSKTAYFQISDELGGIAVYNNYLNMGKSRLKNGYGRNNALNNTGTIYFSDDIYLSDAFSDYYIDTQLKTFSSYESIWAAGWGCSLPIKGDIIHAIGFTGKFLYSALAPGLGQHGEGTTFSFAVDAGYLAVFPSGFRLGCALTNMGPDVFYVDKQHIDPIPFTFNAAVAFTHQFITDNTRVVDIAGEFRIDKELVINGDNGDPAPFYEALFVDPFNEPLAYELQEINYHIGFEAGYYNTVFFRYGVLIDLLGERLETHVGLGVSIYNHIRADLSFIASPEGHMEGLASLFSNNTNGSTGARHKQIQFTIAIDALGGWSEKDGQWWKVNEERSGW